MKPDLLFLGNHYERDRTELAGRFTLLELDATTPVTSLEPDRAAGIRFAALKGYGPVDAAFMDALPKLELIANFAVGYDTIDVAAASQRNIRITNTPGVLNDDVADLAVLLLLSRLRDAYGAEAYLRSGKWPGGDYPLQRKMTGGRVGILGLGRIGRAIADRLAAFNMEISYFARSQKETPGWTFVADPVALAKSVDFLVVAVVGGADTAGLVGRDVLEALGPQGVLVNISRGTVIDEAALIEFLSAGKLGGAALDVFLSEPDIDKRFMGLSNVTLLPHVASATHETRGAMGKLMCANLIAALEGRPLVSPVN